MKYLSHYTREAQTKLFERTGSFFAVSQRQFEERKEPDVEYVTLGAHLVCPKDVAREVAEGLRRISNEGMAADVSENGAAAIIEREYFNHECQISMDTDDARIALNGYIREYPGLFTPELMEATFKACFQKAVDNDWF
jgi:hypothetical protein